MFEKYAFTSLVELADKCEKRASECGDVAKASKLRELAKQTRHAAKKLVESNVKVASFVHESNSRCSRITKQS